MSYVEIVREALQWAEGEGLVFAPDAHEALARLTAELQGAQEEIARMEKFMRMRTLDGEHSELELYELIPIAALKEGK